MRTGLTAQTHSTCKEIIIHQKPTHGSKAAFPYLLNRIILDIYENFSSLSESEKHTTLTRIFYLSQQMEYIVKHSVLSEMHIVFRDKPLKMIEEVLHFNQKNKLYLNKTHVPNVIILDYIKTVELRGEKFSEFYLNLHK